MRVIKNGIDTVKSQSYNLLQNMKLKNVKEDKKRNTGREGAETTLGKEKEKTFVDMSELTEAELEKYWRI